MNEEGLKQGLRESLESKSGEAPGFNESWSAAEAQYLEEKRRYRRASGIVAAVTLTVIALSLLRNEQAPVAPEISVGEDLFTSTLWTAPSDVLIPQYRFDVYQDMPDLIGSTKPEEGALL